MKLRDRFEYLVDEYTLLYEQDPRGAFLSMAGTLLALALVFVLALAIALFLGSWAYFAIETSLLPEIPTLDYPTPHPVQTDSLSAMTDLALLRSVSELTNIPVPDIRSKSRKRPIVYARALSIWALVTLLDRSYGAAARAVGLRDHSSAIHHTTRIEDDISVDVPDVVRDTRALRKIVDALDDLPSEAIARRVRHAVSIEETATHSIVETLRSIRARAVKLDDPFLRAATTDVLRELDARYDLNLFDFS